MNGNIALLLVAALPIVCAPAAWAAGRKDGKKSIAAMVAATAVEMALLLLIAFPSMGKTLTIDNFCGMGLRM